MLLGEQATRFGLLSYGRKEGGEDLRVRTRSRLWEKVEWSQAASEKGNPTNQRNSRVELEVLAELALEGMP